MHSRCGRAGGLTLACQRWVISTTKQNRVRMAGRVISVQRVTPPRRSARQRVRLRILDKESGKPVAVKLHVHGETGEYLAPLDRHRIPKA